MHYYELYYIIYDKYTILSKYYLIKYYFYFLFVKLLKCTSKISIFLQQGKQRNVVIVMKCDALQVKRFIFVAPSV